MLNHILECWWLEKCKEQNNQQKGHITLHLEIFEKELGEEHCLRFVFILPNNNKMSNCRHSLSSVDVELAYKWYISSTKQIMLILGIY